MSAGEFENSKYEASYAAGQIHPIRVQPETLEATIGEVTNEAPDEALTNPISAKVGKGKREFGLGPRMITVEFTGPAPAGYSGFPVTFPALTDAFYEAAIKGEEGEYLGVTTRVVSRTPESVK